MKQNARKKHSETFPTCLSPLQLPKSFSSALCHCFALAFQTWLQTQCQTFVSQRKSAGMAMLTEQFRRFRFTRVLSGSLLDNLVLWGNCSQCATIQKKTFIACTEADFENRPCARENCAKLVRGAFPTSPGNFVRKMCGGIQKCSEIVWNLCGGAPAQFAQSIGVGLPRMCVHKFRANFR